MLSSWKSHAQKYLFYSTHFTKLIWLTNSSFKMVFLRNLRSMGRRTLGWGMMVAEKLKIKKRIMWDLNKVHINLVTKMYVCRNWCSPLERQLWVAYPFTPKKLPLFSSWHLGGTVNWTLFFPLSLTNGAERGKWESPILSNFSHALSMCSGLKRVCAWVTGSTSSYSTVWLKFRTKEELINLIRTSVGNLFTEEATSQEFRGCGQGGREGTTSWGSCKVISLTEVHGRNVRTKWPRVGLGKQLGGVPCIVRDWLHG